MPQGYLQVKFEGEISVSPLASSPKEIEKLLREALSKICAAPNITHLKVERVEKKKEHTDL